MFDWNDLRHFLAVARTGSTLAAARELGVNQTTCARRIQALEEALGQRLFDRTQGGRSLTENGRGLVARAEVVEEAARAFQDQASAQRRSMAGAIRVTCSETIANVAITPALAQFSRLYPEIEVEVIIGDRFFDLVAGEADVAIRAMTRPQWEAGVVVRKLLDVGWALYCSRAYAEVHGVPAGSDDLAGHLLIGASGEMAAAPWFRSLEERPGVVIRSRSSTLANLILAVKSGLGVAAIPNTAADVDPDLIRCSEDIPGADGAIWLVAPERLRDQPRVRAFMDFVSSYLPAFARTGRHPDPGPPNGAWSGAR